MRLRSVAIALFALAGCLAAGQMPPPVAPVRPVTDTYFGTTIVDPYQYMEKLKDPQVEAWMRAQNAYARSVLDSIPGRARVLAEIQKYQQAPSVETVQRLPDGRYIIQRGGKLYIRQGVSGRDRLLVDPAALTLKPADRGLGATTLEEEAVSSDGRYLAVRIIPGGAERQSEIHVYDIAAGRDTGEVLSGLFPRWVAGTHALLYMHGMLGPTRIRCYLHVLGTDQATDRAVFGSGVVPSIPSPPHTEGLVIAPPDSAYAIGWTRSDVGSLGSAYYIEPASDLVGTHSDWKHVAATADDVADVAIHENDLYLLSYKGALNYEVLRTDARQPDFAAAQVIVPASRAVITGIAAAQDALYVTLLDGGFSRLRRVSYGPQPATAEVALPVKGLLENLDVDPRIPGAQFDLTSWTTALTSYTYDPATNSVTRTGLEPARPDDHPADLESEEVMVRSWDGTMVPLSIVHRKGMQRDSSNPALMYAYGAYGLVHFPIFSPGLLAWYQEGGAFAVCHVRGGGELGEAWHLAGKEATKPNTWKDFIACAQYLIDHKYTSPSRLGGWGASAGGIMIGRAIETRPDLFAAAIDENGMSDMLRYETTPNGKANIPEFGTVATPAGFRALNAMSPYAHIHAGVRYPAVLLTTGAHDPRVPPWGAAKMAARLQAATASGKPVLLTVDYQGGHGMIGRTARQTRVFDADLESFMLWQFGMPGFQPHPDPPVAPVRPVTDTYFGTKVVDPYQYMENLHDPEVKAWMRAQNDYARAVLDSIPDRARLLAEMEELARAQPVVLAQRLPNDRYLLREGGKLYMRHGTAGSNRLLVAAAAIQMEPADRGVGGNVIEAEAASGDGRYVAVVIEPGGAFLHTEIHIFNLATGRETGDVLHGAEPSWAGDGETLLYSRNAGPVPRGIRYMHVLGTDPASDRAVFGTGAVPSIPAPPPLAGALTVPPGSAYAIGSINHRGSSPNSAFYLEPAGDLGRTNSGWRKVAGFSDDVHSVVVHGNDLYILSYKNALNYKLLRTDARKPDLARAETVLPESRAVITGISAAQDALYVQLLDGGMSRLLRLPYGPKTHATEVPLPVKGTLANLNTDPRIPGALFDLDSWTRARAIYAYDPAANSVTNTGLQPAGPNDHPADLQAEEVMVRSYDGTMVPLSIIHRTGMKLDGSNPTLMRGYGAYGTSVTPRFVPALLAWYRLGGIYAVCHVRGGGEKGEAWHLAGKGPAKPNTWKDFAACAQYLIRHKYTSARRLGGVGSSAGGILIGRAIEANPELFAAAIDDSGDSDMLRVDTTVNGRENIVEFGSVKTEAGFRGLYAMSPYAHVRRGTAYPAVLLDTGLNDFNVAPWQLAKMAARLQAATSSGKPVLLVVKYHGGHTNLGASRQQLLQRAANQFSFMLWQFGVSGFQPKQ